MTPIFGKVFMEFIFFLLISIFIKCYSTLIICPIYSRLVTKVHLKNAYRKRKHDISFSSF